MVPSTYFLSAICLILSGCSIGTETTFGQWNPDFVSSWLPLTSHSSGPCIQTVPHGLGVVPILVDVQVKSVDPQNSAFMFPGLGAFARDDDLTYNFGGVAYIYNEVNVQVLAPREANTQFMAGAPIFTGDGVKHIGPHQQLTYDVFIRIRAWRSSSLPDPNFSVTGIPVVSNSTDVNTLYVERGHNLGDYPALVRVRTRFMVDEQEWISDSVGASLQTHGTNTLDTVARFVVYGFNNASVRVWIPTTGRIFDATDTSASSIASSSGLLEMFAWRASTAMRPKFSHRFTIGPIIPTEQLQQTVPTDMSARASYVIVWAECLSGNNRGFRFPGSGSLSYDVATRDSTCTFGGLTYGYSSGTLRLWIPSNVANGGVICIADSMGMGINSQLARDAAVVVHYWSANILHQAEENVPRMENTCG